MASYFAGYLQTLNYALESSIFTHQNGVALPAEAYFAETLAAWKRCRDHNGRIYVLGNGGSQAIASHMTTDMIKSLALPAQAFSDASNLTCLSNDYGYAAAYAHQLEVFACAEDIVIAISSSGQSQNMLNALRVANDRSLWTMTFTGFSPDNPLRQAGALNFYVPSHEYGFVELSHGVLCHALCEFAAKQWQRGSVEAPQDKTVKEHVV